MTAVASSTNRSRSETPALSGGRRKCVDGGKSSRVNGALPKPEGLPFPIRFFLSKKLKAEIAGLQARGDYRPKGLVVPNITMIFFQLTMVPAIIWSGIEFHNNVEYFAFITIGLSIIYVLLCYGARGEGIRLMSTGRIVKAKVRWAFDEIIDKPVWRIKFDYKDLDGNIVSNYAVFFKWLVKKSDVFERGYITVFFDPSRPRRCHLLIPWQFRNLCLSESRFKKLKNNPFMWEERNVDSA